jgi:hypothetical protein
VRETLRPKLVSGQVTNDIYGKNFANRPIRQGVPDQRGHAPPSSSALPDRAPVQGHRPRRQRIHAFASQSSSASLTVQRFRGRSPLDTSWCGSRSLSRTSALVRPVSFLRVRSRQAYGPR